MTFPAVSQHWCYFDFSLLNSQRSHLRNQVVIGLLHFDCIDQGWGTYGTRYHLVWLDLGNYRQKSKFNKSRKVFHSNTDLYSVNHNSNINFKGQARNIHHVIDKTHTSTWWDRHGLLAACMRSIHLQCPWSACIYCIDWENSCCQGVHVAQVLTHSG